MKKNLKHEIARVEAQIKLLGAIENEFKDLGKFLYACWKDGRKHHFCSIMDEFHERLTKLEAIKKKW